MERMQILFINRYFFPDPSATSQILTELTEDLDAEGRTVSVVTGRSAYLGGQRLPREDRHKGIRIIRVSSTNFGRHHPVGRLFDYLSFYISALWTVLRLPPPACLVVMSDPPLLSVLAAVVGMVKRCPTVCWLQDVFPDIAVQAGVLRRGRLATLLGRLATQSLKRMTRVVVLGRCMERHVVKAGISATSVTQLPNWADGSAIQPVERKDNPFIQEHGLQGKFVVMYSGNFGQVHEYDTVRSVIAMLQQFPDIIFCCIGDGLYRQALAKEAADCGWPHVLFLPYENKERLAFSLSAGHLHLVSLKASMVGLSVPSKVYAIMAAGRPMLYVGPASSEAALIIQEAGCGSVIEPGDQAAAIKAVLMGYRDRELLERQGLAGRAHFQDFCDRRLATTKFRTLLQQICR